MDEKEIVVPDGMLKAVKHAYYDTTDPGRTFPNYLLEAALQWLSENPIVPTREQCAAMVAPRFGILAPQLNGNMTASAEIGAVEWQRRMFRRTP